MIKNLKKKSPREAKPFGRKRKAGTLNEKVQNSGTVDHGTYSVGHKAKKNIIYNVYVNLVRDPISYITGNSFNVLYKLSNKKL